MNKGVIAMILILVLTLSLIGYLYYEYEIKTQEEISEKAYANIFIYNEKGMKITSGYRVFINGKEYKNGTSSFIGGTQVQVPTNRSVYFYNYNLEDQNYYITEEKVNTARDKNYLISMTLRKAGELRVESLIPLSDDKKEVELKISSDRQIQYPAVCLEKTNTFLYAEINNNNFTEITVPERLDEFEKCYKYNKDLIEENDLLPIPIEYLLFDKLKKDDYIKVLVIDGNKVNDKLIYDKDIGSPDFEYLITK